MAHTDKFGYLWLATERGVVKYNGYSFKVFNFFSGLLDDDIYGLQADSSDRLWLYGFSGKLAYIKNDQIRYPRNSSQYSIPRTHFITPFGKDILFYFNVLYGIRNDSIYATRDSVGAINDQGQTFVFRDSVIFEHMFINGKLVNVKRHKNIPVDLSFQKLSFGRKFFYYSRESDKIIIHDIDSGTLVTQSLYNERGIADTIHYAHQNGEFMFAYSRTNTYKINRALRVERLSLDSLFGDIGQAVPSHLLCSDRWNYCLSTQNRGLFIRDRLDTAVNRYTTADLAGFVNVGSRSDSISYWWNRGKRSLMILSSGGLKKTLTINGAILLSRVIPYSRELSLVSTAAGISVLDERKMKLYPRMNWREDGTQKVVTDGLMNPTSLTLVDSVTGFLNAFNSFIQVKLQKDQDAVLKFIDRGMYKSVVHSKKMKLTFAYGFDEVLLYKAENNQKLKIPLTQMRQYGISNIEQVFLDVSNRNVLIKSHTGLFSYDISTHLIKELNLGVALSNSKVLIAKGNIVAAGPFGIAITRVQEGMHQRPRIFCNHNEHFYSDVNSLISLKDVLLLNTDRGAYTLRMDAEPHVQGNSGLHELVVTYQDSTYLVGHGDTICLEQDNTNIFLDVVNSHAKGPLRITYNLPSVGNTWHRTEGANMMLSELKPGQYVSALLKVQDDHWSPKPIKITLFVKPYWWQTLVGKGLLIAAIVIVISALIIAAVVVTRLAIIKKNHRQNQLLELELKSIYSQINPHFVFNSLNSALSLIATNRKDEAYDHVRRFSGLLRGFIRSSRERFITLHEETENLRNYIELQQTRFSFAFSYDLVVAPNINPMSTKLPSLLIQPLVENAIIHGLLPKENGGWLTITFSLDDKNHQLTCAIEDNGIGREKSKQLYTATGSGGTSYGSVMISDLIEIFNKREDVKINISYNDKLPPECGLVVMLTIKSAKLYDREIQLYHY